MNMNLENIYNRENNNINKKKFLFDFLVINFYYVLIFGKYIYKKK